MRYMTLIFLVLFLSIEVDASAVMVKPTFELTNSTKNLLENKNKSIQLNGVMTKLSDSYSVINGKQYMNAENMIVKYANGSPVQDKLIFNASESVNVIATIQNNEIQEIIIINFNLRE